MERGKLHFLVALPATILSFGPCVRQAEVLFLLLPLEFCKLIGTRSFRLPARVVNIEDKESILLAELENLDLETGNALLFKTNNSIGGRCRNALFSEGYVYLSPEAVDFCVEKKVSLVGIDYITIEAHGDEAFPAHRKLLGNNILVLEGINLKEVPAGTYTLLCLPLKIKGGEASPVRAILFR